MLPPMTNIIDLSSIRTRRDTARAWATEQAAMIVLVTGTGKVAAYLGPPDGETGDAVFVDEEEAYIAPLSMARNLAETMSQTPSALLMALGGFHLTAVIA